MNQRSIILGILFVAAALSVAALLHAQGPGQLEQVPSAAGNLPASEMPPEFRDVELNEHLGAQVPFDAKLLDQDGQAVVLGDKFAGALPTLLTLNYFDCPMLCKLELNGLVESMRKATPTLGKDFRVVTVSIDPRDNPAKAKLGQQRYLKEYDRPVGGSRPWEFLVGPEAEVRRLADTVGFGYKWIAKQKEYAHHAAIFVCSPQGKVCRVLYGVKYDPATLKLAIIEASEGRVGSVAERFLLLCYQWDPHSGRYHFPMTVMRIGGGAVALTIAGMLTWLLRRDRRIRLRQDETGGDA